MEFNIYAVFLILILAIGIAILIYSIPTDGKSIIDSNIVNGSIVNGSIVNGGIIGGTVAALFAGNESDKTLTISDNAKIVIDGHNLIHDLIYDKGTFTDGLKKLSEVLSEIPNKDIHLVLKNPNDSILASILKSDKVKSTDYIDEILKISRDYPNLTYNLAYKKETKTVKKETNKDHYKKGRDDFLSIYLSEGGYIVSKDKFRDFSKFTSIKPFTHYIIKNGHIVEKKKIDPSKYISQSINKPTIGTHLYYKFVNRKDNSLLHNKVIVDKEGTNSILYLAV